METAYSILLTLGESELAHVWCDLSAHKIYFKDKVIFESGRFCNMENADMLNSVPLIEHESGNWVQTVATLYEAYAGSYPKRFKHSNFLHKKSTEDDFLFAPDTYHSSRLALELYFIFHNSLADLSWENPTHFMRPICDSCIVKREWLL